MSTNASPTAQKQAFDRDGFISVDPLYNGDEMAAINQEMSRFLADGIAQMPPEQVYLEDRSDKSSVKQLMHLYKYNAFFHEMIFNGPARRIAEEVLGEEVVPVNMQFFNKPAGIGKPTPPHQDGYYFHLKPCQAVTGWLALEPVDHENGCIHYVRGSHREEEFRPHGGTGVLGFSQGVTDFGTEQDKANTVACPGQPGTFLIHHARTIHWATPNVSKTRTRRALGFIYYAKSAKPDLEAKQAYQEALDASLKAQGKI